MNTYFKIIRNSVLQIDHLSRYKKWKQKYLNIHVRLVYLHWSCRDISNSEKVFKTKQKKYSLSKGIAQDKCRQFFFLIFAEKYTGQHKRFWYLFHKTSILSEGHNSAKPDQTPQNAASDQVLHSMQTEVSFKI